MESLTDRIEDEAWAIIGEVDRRGGAVKAIRDGYIQREIENSSYLFQKRIDAGERKLVGVQPGRDPDPIDKAGYSFDPRWETDQVERLKALKAKRSQAKIDEHLNKIAEVARTGENLMPYVVQAVKDYATEGEVTAALESVFGRHRE